MDFDSKLPKGHNSSCQLLDVFCLLWCFHDLNSLDFLRIVFDPLSRDHEPHELSCLNTKGALSWVQHHIVCLNISKALIRSSMCVSKLGLFTKISLT